MKNLSTTGYKKNSPDKDRPYNVIPSGEITMKNVGFPVLINNVIVAFLSFSFFNYFFFLLEWSFIL